jgi:tetratricopeptide (TPR) repeat protein
MNGGTLLTPLSIVLAFIGVIEATLAFRVTSLDGTAQMIFVWFMVTFPAAVLAGFFYIQITAPLSWYPPSELDKASTKHLQFLDKSSQKLISVEMLDSANLSQSKTIGGTSLTSQAIELYRKGDYQQALNLFEKAVLLEADITAASGANVREVAQTQTNIGTTLSSLGRYEEAIVAFKRALELYQKSGDESSTGVVLNNIGSVYKNMGRYEEAVATYELSL